MKTIRELLKDSYNLGFIGDYLELDNIVDKHNYDREILEQELLEEIAEREIIYFSKAIEFLSENDPSLEESLSIADELGYTPDKLNSEVLATLLLQELIRGELSQLLDMIEAKLFEKSNNE